MADTRIAVAAIVVENSESAVHINTILHEYAGYIVGRMGIPYRERNVSIISVAMDAPTDVIASMTGKLGNLPGVNVKTAYSKN